MRRSISLALALAVGATVLSSVVTAGATGPHGYEFVEMPDGVKIAVSVSVPDSCYVTGCPTIFEMSGYDGGGADSADGGTLSREYGLEPFIGLGDDSRQLTRHFDDAAENGTGDYAVVHASVRGSGCSGGEFDLFTWQGALDGKYIIDNWIPTREWSNGDVGIIGHSYGGLTGTLVAATQPEHLKVISVSGLIDDLYRGITYPGGVSNYGFPLLWTGGIRTAYDVGGGLLPRLLRPITGGYEAQSAECAQNLATRNRSVINDAIVQGSSDTDTDWFRSRSLINHVSKITVPVHIVGAYQDEQTGARGPTHVWEAIESPKRLVLSNGDHGTAGLYPGTDVRKDRVDWLNHYLFGTPFAGGLSDPKVDESRRVRVYLETNNSHAPNGIIDTTEFPLPETAWKTYYLAPGSLVDDAPAGGNAQYVSGSVRNGWFRQFGEAGGTPFTTRSGPDMLEFTTTIASDTTVVGPIMAELELSSTAPDTELFVEVIDEAPATPSAPVTRAYLQRGLLKASHRAIVPSNSDCVDPASANAHASCETPGAVTYRPYRPHARADLLTPGTPYRVLVEIWPLGHVFRAGHTLRVHVTTPPLFDNYYAYVPKRPVGMNTVYFGEYSKITLPVIPAASATFAKPLGAARTCAQQDALRCITSF